jgi:hypothetical protein
VNVYTSSVPWTPAKAIQTDEQVRRELRTSRASLIQFVAEGAWRLLPAPHKTAAAYVQDAAGVKRSEAYRLVATARVAQMLLARFVQRSEEELELPAYEWMMSTVIKSSHTGEYLCSIIHELTLDIEGRINPTTDVYTAINAGVEAHQRPDGDDDSSPALEPGEPGSATTGPDAEPEGSPYPDIEDIEKAERILICPHCQMPLR